MSVNEIEMNYELEDMNVNIFHRADLNKLVIAEGEDLDRFSCKSLLFYVLRSELGHDVITDFHVIGVGNVDILDLSTRTVYVFEMIGLIEFQGRIDELYPDSEVGVIAIDKDDLPNDLFQRYLKLREYVITY